MGGSDARRPVPLPGLVAVRTVQYGVVAPLAVAAAALAVAGLLIGRMAKAAGELGCLGVVLLFLPVIGWIILLAVWLGTSGSRAAGRELRRQRRSGEWESVAVFVRSALRPWCRRA